MLLRSFQLQFSLMSLSLLLVSCDTLLNVDSTNNQSSAIFSIVQIIETDNCTAPCLFGLSLEDANYEGVLNVLQASEWMEDTEIQIDEDFIRWDWSIEVESQLISKPFQDLYDHETINSIYFQDDMLMSSSIIFSVSVEDIIARYGEAFTIYPFRYDGAITTYALAYPEFNGGVFEAKLNCTNAQMTPDTLVLRFTYERNFQLRITEPRIVQWAGYETVIQGGCSPFQP